MTVGEEVHLWGFGLKLASFFKCGLTGHSMRGFRRKDVFADLFKIEGGWEQAGVLWIHVESGGLRRHLRHAGNCIAILDFRLDLAQALCELHDTISDEVNRLGGFRRLQDNWSAMEVWLSVRLQEWCLTASAQFYEGVLRRSQLEKHYEVVWLGESSAHINRKADIWLPGWGGPDEATRHARADAELEEVLERMVEVMNSEEDVVLLLMGSRSHLLLPGVEAGIDVGLRNNKLFMMLAEGEEKGAVHFTPLADPHWASSAELSLATLGRQFGMLCRTMEKCTETERQDFGFWKRRTFGPQHDMLFRFFVYSTMQPGDLNRIATDIATRRAFYAEFGVETCSWGRPLREDGASRQSFMSEAPTACTRRLVEVCQQVVQGVIRHAWWNQGMDVLGFYPHGLTTLDQISLRVVRGVNHDIDVAYNRGNRQPLYVNIIENVLLARLGVVDYNALRGRFLNRGSREASIPFGQAVLLFRVNLLRERNGQRLWIAVSEQTNHYEWAKEREDFYLYNYRRSVLR